MVKTFADKRAVALFPGKRPKGFPGDAIKRARKQFQILDQAVELADLRLPPSNHLENLTGKRAGLHSIRINRQWRLCFRWFEGDAYDVEITDYH